MVVGTAGPRYYREYGYDSDTHGTVIPAALANFCIIQVKIYRVATHLQNLEKSGNSKVVREKSGKMKKVRETEIMFIIDTLVAFSKLVTMLVIINGKRLFKRYAVY